MKTTHLMNNNNKFNKINHNRIMIIIKIHKTNNG